MEEIGIGWTLAMLAAFAFLSYGAFHLAKKHITAPRMGLVKFGMVRKKKLKKLTIVLSGSALLGVILFILILALKNTLPGWMLPITIFGVNCIIVFSLGAYFLDFPRLYGYGILYALAFQLSILLNEWFELNVNYSFPAVYGAFAGIMVVIGTVISIRFLRKYPRLSLDDLDARE
ncbi:MAG: hypothetical protein MUO76_04435 [Anaerolineaceae bacterium]|nr:hypothetical protein [Anaerolineaceae bacterium]